MPLALSENAFGLSFLTGMTWYGRALPRAGEPAIGGQGRDARNSWPRPAGLPKAGAPSPACETDFRQPDALRELKVGLVMTFTAD